MAFHQANSNKFQWFIFAENLLRFMFDRFSEIDTNNPNNKRKF